jgi:hypothetical protein
LLDGGIRLEAVLLGGFGLLIAGYDDLTDPRITYVLHELGEETRHSRLFIRMLDQLSPVGTNPFGKGIGKRLTRRIHRRVTRSPALLCTMVLAGEEIPDLIQRRQVEHEGTDDYLRRCNQYHRQEEARHLAFARMLLPEIWQRSGRLDRALVKHAAPLLVTLLLDTQLIHPGIYSAVGLPGRRTWKAVQRTDQYSRMRHEATRPLLAAVAAAVPEMKARVPRSWRRLCGVDRAGRPVDRDSV